MAGLSIHNPAVQHLRRLSRHRDARREAGAFVIDGPTLVDDALEAGIELECVFVDEARLSEASIKSLLSRAETALVRRIEVAPGVLKKVLDVVEPPGVAAIARCSDRPFSFVTSTASGFVLVFDGVSDPGNAGTLLRSADASGAKAVVVCQPSVDLYNPKTVRSSAGALFRVPIVDGGQVDHAFESLSSAGYRVVGTASGAGQPFDEADLTGAVAIVLGNEAHGLSEAAANRIVEWIHIPMVGRSESLNVAMAGTLIAFETERQRRLGPQGH